LSRLVPLPYLPIVRLDAGWTTKQVNFYLDVISF